MNAAKHNPSFAKEAGISQTVAKEFSTSGSRYKSLPERKDSEVKKKKGWIKKDKGEKKLKAKLSEPKRKSEAERMSDRYGGKK